jgi:predicted transcriptional regulator
MENKMATKLTLTLDKETIKIAKEYAKRNNISLSGIVELYFKVLSSNARDYRISPITRELSGIASLSTTKSDKELLEEALNKRFL